MKKLSLRYLYILSACIIILLSAGLYYKYTKLHISNKTNTDTTNPNLVKDTSEANKPVLADGMIPIIYNETLNTWVKADIKNTNFNWYNYDNQKWANSVMLTTETRDKYMKAEISTPILEADILAYFVWIPRYKYKLFNVSYSSIDSQVIDVIFENGTNTTGETKCQVSEIGVETCTNKKNGKYYTHPAFTFGDTELEGIWVGKFETTGSATTPTVKPVTSLKNQNVSTQFTTSQKFNSTNYLTTNGVNQTDAHMMKNIEWGAVAYLKQSKYGLGLTDIGVNNYCSYITGCGAMAESSSSSTCNTYNTEMGMLASTTGNITGVYDMSGGAYEYVMGVMQDNSDSSRPMSGNSTFFNSGYIGKVFYDMNCAGNCDYGYVNSGNILSFPNSKYYDLYANGSTYEDQTAYNRSHLGDATGETRNWYSDNANFVYPVNPWFLRGGICYNRTNAGIFNFNNDMGSDGTSFGFRIVLSTVEA